MTEEDNTGKVELEILRPPFGATVPVPVSIGPEALTIIITATMEEGDVIRVSAITGLPDDALTYLIGMAGGEVMKRTKAGEEIMERALLLDEMRNSMKDINDIGDLGFN